MNNIKYQNYSHYKLPITMDPLKYGKLIEQIGNKYIITLTTPTNIAVIKHINNENFVRIFRKGELIFEYKEIKISDFKFIRIISDQKFTFENNKLIATEILNASGSVIIFNSNNITPLNSPLVTQFNYKTSLIKWLENTYIFKHKKAELFILFELFLIFLVYIIFFVIFPDVNEDSPTITLAAYNVFKLRKTNSINSWNTMEFSNKNLLFTTDLFKSKFNLFWDKVYPGFTNNNHMFILFKIKYKGSDYTTIGNLQRLNKIDKIWYLNWIINNMIYKSEYYNETPVVSFIFSYGFKDEKIADKEVISVNVNFQKYKNNNLVISYNPLDFGKLISEFKRENYTQFILQTRDNLLVNINKFDKYNDIKLISGSNTIFKFKDEFISDNTFVRFLDNKKYYFENNKEILFTKQTKGEFIPKLKVNKNLTNKFITLDVETYIKDSILIVYCISIFDGLTKKTFWLNDYKDPEELIMTALKSIMIRKYNRSNVYIHNLAKFDIIFLLKYLVKLGTVQPIIHNDRIIYINFNFGKNGEYQLQFKDSYLLLLNSLMKLCKSFKVENAKSIFPHFFVKENNLNYIGEVPNIKYFGNKIDKKDYNEYKATFNGNWNLKNEATKYCELDCISLHQVIYKFTDMIFELFNKNVHHYPTLPGLAMAIFRSNFMFEENIPQLSGKIAKDIRLGYTGGATDMYIPKSTPGVNIKAFDVNSLYPSIMKICEMPVGIPSYFNGDIRKINPEAFGFFYCEIIAPDDIKHPIIQTHVKTNNGTRTISPIGSWEDMVFSCEMDNAINYGYKFKILWGYTFERKIIFNDYVDFLYNLRRTYSKSDPMNFIAKILLNSLYGRFGMDDNFLEVNIIHKDYYSDFENKFLLNILRKVELGNYMLVTHKAIDEENDESTHNVSISIAAAITAYSRIYMTQFKNNPKINLYYTDTDSIYTDSEFDDSFISDTILGKLKLENTCKEAIFLAPKLYCLKTVDNELIYKVKGLKHEVELTMNDFEKLLNKDVFIKKSQTKWMRNLSEGKITLLEQVYTLNVTDNKRELIHNKNKLVGTKAYRINKDKVIIG